MTLASGTRLGPYQVIAPLGAGGMGEVYRARDTRLGRDVAIKILPQGGPASADERARFRREAKTISSLNHPHICVLHDIGQEGDTDYLVMELVEGETLARRIAKGPLPTAEVLRIGAQIADALDRAHRAGVVHRDLKPGNVMLTKTGAKLMDFGLAREFTPAGRDPEATVTDGGAGPDESITKKGMIVGTFQYMAPEQLEGRRADARSDIWALGCVLYEMATGKRAFEGSTPISVISAIMRDEPRRISELVPLTPPAFERLVRACLAKDPDDRIQAAHDARLQLQWMSEPTSADIPRHRRRLAGFALIGATLLIGGLGATALWGGRDQAPRFSFYLLTHKRMTIFRAAFVPHGNAVVFSAATTGNSPQLFEIQPEYPDPRPISEPGTHLLSVSSRGEMAVLTHAQYFDFLGWFRGTLARLPVGGGAPREVLENVAEADWTPDGSQLAVLCGRGSGPQLEFPIGNVLYRPKTGYLRNIRFSPKGDAIAFIENSSGRTGPGTSVAVIDLRGKIRRLIEGHSLTGLAWRHDGEALFVSGMIDSVSDAIYMVPMSGKPRLVFQGQDGLRIHDIAEDGRWLGTRDDERQAVMVHRPGWAEDRDLSWLGGSSDGALSKNADSLVFTEQGMNDGPAVCVRQTGGSPVVRLCSGVNYVISPDGSRVITLEMSHPQKLALQPIGAGDSKVLARGPIETYYGAWWFPSGDSILVMGQEPGIRARLYVQDVEGGGPPRAIPGTDGGSEPAIAPDGSWVILSGGKPSGYLRFRFDGSPPERVAALRPGDVLLRRVWDAHTVLSSSGRTIPYRIQKVDITNGKRSLALEVSPPDETGLMLCRVTSFSEDFRSYSYDANWILSSLYVATPFNRREP